MSQYWKIKVLRDYLITYSFCVLIQFYNIKFCPYMPATPKCVSPIAQKIQTQTFSFLFTIFTPMSSQYLKFNMNSWSVFKSCSPHILTHLSRNSSLSFPICLGQNPWSHFWFWFSCFYWGPPGRGPVPVNRGAHSSSAISRLWRSGGG